MEGSSYNVFSGPSFDWLAAGNFEGENVRGLLTCLLPQKFSAIRYQISSWSSDYSATPYACLPMKPTVLPSTNSPLRDPISTYS